MAPHVTAIAWGRLEGMRPRTAGCNARLDEHGIFVRPGVARITLSDGSTGMGWSRASQEQGAALLGKSIEGAHLAPLQVDPAWLPVEFPLWDLLGRRAGVSVAQLVAGSQTPTGSVPARVPCYDTSLYIDDLHLDSTPEAAALIADEARQGYEHGHRAFKIKVGRGSRHMPLEQGIQRDIAVIHNVRQVVGASHHIMIDANNGYNLNITKRVLEETADCRLFWIEEPFHEDPVLYADLKEWMSRAGITTLIADGEGLAAPPLLSWARQGLIDVVQYDIFGHGFAAWLATGAELDVHGVKSAPHHYGQQLGNFVTNHLAGAIQGFTATEWDEAPTPGIDASLYHVDDGSVTLPAAPGFGIEYDSTLFERAVHAGGWRVGG